MAQATTTRHPKNYWKKLYLHEATRFADTAAQVEALEARYREALARNERLNRELTRTYLVIFFGTLVIAVEAMVLIVRVF